MSPTPVPAHAALPRLHDCRPSAAGRSWCATSTTPARYNKLGNHRFVRFTLDHGAHRHDHRELVESEHMPDPDFRVFRNGAFVDRRRRRSAGSRDRDDRRIAAAGDYLIDVYDCANGCDYRDQGTPGDYDLTVTVN